MNRKLSALLVLGAFISIAANATVVGSWERPIKQASMEEIDGEGKTVGVGLDRILTLNKRDGAKKPTTFSFREEVRVYCVTAPCPPITRTTLYRIAKIKVDGCNSTIYTANEILPLNSKKIAEVLTVADHDARVCEDYKPFLWEATLKLPVAGKPARLLRGNPEPVYTIQ